MEMLDWKTTAQEVAEIRELYRRVWDLKSQINNTYSFQMFMTIAHTFLQLIYYAFLNSLINKDMETSLKIMKRGNVFAIKVINHFRASLCL